MKHLRSKMIVVLALVVLMIVGCGGKDESTEQPTEKENVSSSQTVENQEAGTESMTELETESEIASETTENTSRICRWLEFYQCTSATNSK